MGASSDEIDTEIRETRSQLDQNLEILEQRAASGARKYRRIAVGIGVGVAVVVVGAVAYRRYRRRAVVKHLRDVLVESVRDLPDGVASRLRGRLPFKVVVTDRASEESTPRAWASIARTVAPAVAGSAAGAVFSRVINGAPKAPPQAE